MTIRELREKRDTYLNTARAITDGAVGDNRDLTPEERADFDRLTAKIDSLNETLKRHNRISDLQDELARPINQAIKPDVGGAFREPRPGEVRLLRPSDRLADIYGRSDGDDLSIGRAIRGLAIGRWDGAEAERRAMNEGVGSAGGWIVPTSLSARVIDLARAQSVISRAGATLVPMSSKELAMARLAADPTAGWKVENEAATESAMEFEQIKFEAKSLVALCKLSVELFEDATNLDSVVTNSLSQALAGELDRVALIGSGVAPEPQGIFGADGVQTISADGPITYVQLVRAFGAVRAANGMYNAVIVNPREWEAIENLYDSYGRPVAPPVSWLYLTDPARDGLYLSTRIPTNLGTGENEAIAIVGDMSKLMIGMRTEIVLEVSRHAADDQSSAFKNLQVFVRAYLRADVALATPSHFAVLTGIVPAA